VRPEPSSPARPDDLALVDGEAERLDRALAAQLGGLQERRAASPRPSAGLLLLEPLQDVELLADHLLDERELRQLGGQVLADEACRCAAR
jgi:hypothetical protein